MKLYGGNTQLQQDITKYLLFEVITQLEQNIVSGSCLRGLGFTEGGPRTLSLESLKLTVNKTGGNRFPLLLSYDNNGKSVYLNNLSHRRRFSLSYLHKYQNENLVSSIKYLAKDNRSYTLISNSLKELDLSLSKIGYRPNEES